MPGPGIIIEGTLYFSAYDEYALYAFDTQTGEVTKAIHNVNMEARKRTGSGIRKVGEVVKQGSKCCILQ
jgi:hypothetical protein